MFIGYGLLGSTSTVLVFYEESVTRCEVCNSEFCPLYSLSASPEKCEDQSINVVGAFLHPSKNVHLVTARQQPVKTES